MSDGWLGGWMGWLSLVVGSLRAPSVVIDITPIPNQVVTSFRALSQPHAMMKWAAGTKPFGSFDKIEGFFDTAVNGE